MFSSSNSFHLKEKKWSVSDYPYFNPSHINRKSRSLDENCLSYALNHRLSAPGFVEFFQENQKDVSTTLNYVSEEINKYYDDSKFSLVAKHEAGKLPPIMTGYYLIVFYMSTKGKITVNGTEFTQKMDYHFLIQNNDGYFSHRRGQSKNAEKLDAAGNKIIYPEKANFFYTSQKDSKACHNYKFYGYLHIKSLELRKQNVNETKQTISYSLPKWEKVGNFKEYKFLTDPYKRDMYLLNKSEHSKIQYLHFFEDDNTLKMLIRFSDLDVCNNVLDTWPETVVNSSNFLAKAERIYYAPATQLELESMIERILKIEPTDKKNMYEFLRCLSHSYPKNTLLKEYSVPEKVIEIIKKVKSIKNDNKEKYALFKVKCGFFYPPLVRYFADAQEKVTKVYDEVFSSQLTNNRSSSL